MEHYDFEQQLKSNPRVTLHSHKSTINIIRWSPDGNILASGGKDKLLNIHRVQEAEIVVDPQNTTKGHVAEINHICWNWDNPNLLVTAGLDRHLKVWDMRYVNPIHSIKIKNELNGLTWSNSGQTIAMADKADVVSFVDVRLGWDVASDHKFQYEICDLAWNHEGDFLHLVTGDGKMLIYSYPQMQNLMTVDAFGTACSLIRFDQSGKYFTIGSHDAISSVWDYENLACIQAIDRLGTQIHSAAFSFDGRYIATGSHEDRIIDVADSLTGDQILPVELGSYCHSLDFHPKDYILAYSLTDHEQYRDMGTIKIMGFPDTRRPPKPLYG